MGQLTINDRSNKKFEGLCVLENVKIEI